MKHLNLFIELTRLNKPIGYMLLFWPCLWGLTLVYNFNNEIYTYIKVPYFFSTWLNINEISRLYCK